MSNSAMYRQGRVAALIKLGYYSSYDSYERDPYTDMYQMSVMRHNAAMQRDMEERKELERLQGRIHRSGADDAARQKMLDSYVQERANEGRAGGQLTGGLLGAIGGGMLGHAIGKVPGTLIGGSLGGYAGYSLGGPWGESAGREAGEDLVERAHAASLAPSLRNG